MWIWGDGELVDIAKKTLRGDVKREYQMHEEIYQSHRDISYLKKTQM